MKSYRLTNINSEELYPEIAYKRFVSFLVGVAKGADIIANAYVMDVTYASFTDNVVKIEFITDNQKLVTLIKSEIHMYFLKFED